MKTGIDLIAEERQEQIHKHEFSLERDAEFYKKKELKQAAEYCLMLGEFGRFKNKNIFWPDGCDKYFEHKIINKSRVGKLIVAGAFYMAENERRNDDIYSDNITEIATEIDNSNIIIMKTVQSFFYNLLPDGMPNKEAEDISKEMTKREYTKVEDFIHHLGLTDVADEMHRHPKSGSDYSIRSLLETFVGYSFAHERKSITKVWNKHNEENSMDKGSFEKALVDLVTNNQYE